MNLITPSTHAQRLERLLGADKVKQLGAAMKGWYGPPVGLGDVPGAVYIGRDGDFRGRINAGQFTSLRDYVEQRLKRIARNVGHRQLATAGAGFQSLSDLISEATTGGKKRTFLYHKTGVAADAVGASVSLWGLGDMPAAGANATAAPLGDDVDSSFAGAFPFTNPTGGDTQHYVGAKSYADFDSRILLLYDRLFQVDKTMASLAAESVTGVPSRYQSSTATDPDYAAGNFVFPEVGATLLASTAHNHLTLQYRNQAGTDAQSAPSAAGVSGMNARGIDLVPGSWFIPLASGDTGIMDLAQIQLDANVATGVLNYVIGHPIVMLTLPQALKLEHDDGIMTAFNLTRIFDDAALALLSLSQASVDATVFNSTIETVAG